MGIEGLFVRRALRNVEVADLLRRALAVAPRLVGHALLPLVVLYVPLAGLFGVLGLELMGSREPDVVAELGTATLTAYSWLVAPALGGALGVSAIRASFRDRPSLVAALREIWGGLGRALLPGLAAGALATLGYAVALGASLSSDPTVEGLGRLALAFHLAALPALLSLPWLFVVGPTAALEKLDAGTAFRRALTLTRGQRWRLLVAIVVVGVVERLLFRLAHFGLFILLVSVLMTLFRACLIAVAYADLRVVADGLEPDGMLAVLGGKLDGESELVAATSSKLEAAARRRVWGQRVVLGTIALALLGALGAWGHSKWRDRRDEAAREARYRAAAEANAQVLRERAAREPARSSAWARDADDASSAPTAETREPDEEIARRIALADEADRLALVGRELASRAAELYGRGYSRVFHQLAKTSLADLELAVLPLLSLEARGIGCGDAVDVARQKPTKKQATSFAAQCPPGKEKRALAPKQAATMPLWAAVLAIELELRARDNGVADNPLHQRVIATLLAVPQVD